MDVLIAITVSTDVKLAIARSLGHKAPATYPVVKRWMEQALRAALDDLIKAHMADSWKRPRTLVHPDHKPLSSDDPHD
ncbi:MAG TPA: hypothetical protein VJ692_03495 [Nitrospiraceae bacterium]|nr:hypothetical protein [Nitrospiraceae bacterium]